MLRSPLTALLPESNRCGPKTQAAHRSGSLGLLRWLIWAPALSAHVTEFFLDPQSVGSLSSNFIFLSSLGVMLAWQPDDSPNLK